MIKIINSFDILSAMEGLYDTSTHASIFSELLNKRYKCPDEVLCW